MKFYADLHIHSRYSRATSKGLTLAELAYWAQLKGIRVIGTGDFLHPGWLAEIRENLIPAEPGLLQLRPEVEKQVTARVPAACQAPVRFLLSTEIANIYKRLDRVRKVHNLVFAPDLAAAEQLQTRLSAIGNIRSDGRPILGLDSRDLLEIVLETDPQAALIPAHIWTPWFSALGSKGGFDRMADCFGDLTGHIFAVETGLSSDPPMNWRLSQLDDYAMISNSDAHSASKLGREATIFDVPLSYAGIYQALSAVDNPGLLGTVEFFPEEGKYHLDGHRACQVRLQPAETRQQQGLCPACGRPVVVGVMSRVEELADHPAGRKSPRWRPFYSLVPLPEVIAEARGVGPNSKAVQGIYHDLLARLGNELSILMDLPLTDIERVAGDLIAEGIRRVRAGELQIAAGYDGEYGTVAIFSDQERDQARQQMVLFG